MLTRRSANSPDDLAAIDRFIGEVWLAERPHVPFTVVVLEWLMSLSAPDVSWTDRVHLWEDDGEVVGAAWFAPDGMAEGLVRADHRHGPIEEEADVLHAVWALRDGHTERGRYAIDGLEGEAALWQRLGFTPTASSLTQWYQTLAAPTPPPALPDGYRVRTLAGRDELPARVEVHRAAFAPSYMTLERYVRATTQPHYAMDRDVVVEAPDGTLAAFALTWFDPVARIGEFEPVGTHPDHRRRGLALAALRHGLGLLRDAGAIDAMVFSRTDNDASQALYAAAGFSSLAVHRRWARPTEAG